jgi:hypothetical protein
MENRNNYMKAKHTFKYIQEEGGENFSPVEVTFEIPTGEVTITEMLYNFECYLKACGFVFDGHLEVVDEEKYDGPEADDTDGGCMADWDTLPTSVPSTPPYQTGDFFEHQPTSVCSSDKHNITAEDPNKYFPSKWTKAERKVKEWNEGIAKLDNEQKMKNYKDARKMSDLHYEATKEIEKNKWVHGMCNPPSPDWKKKQENNWYHNE